VLVVAGVFVVALLPMPLPLSSACLLSLVLLAMAVCFCGGVVMDAVDVADVLGMSVVTIAVAVMFVVSSADVCQRPGSDPPTTSHPPCRLQAPSLALSPAGHRARLRHYFRSHIQCPSQMGDLYAVKINAIYVDQKTALCELVDDGDDTSIPPEVVGMNRLWIRVKACAWQWCCGCVC